MDAFGFYAVPDGTLDMVEFLSANLAGVCRGLCLDKTPAVICTDDLVTVHGPAAVIFYSPGPVEITDTATGEQHAMRNVFVVRPQSVWEQFGPLMGDMESLFIALWQTIFHEVRHFVQCQVFGESACRDMLLTEAVLAYIARRNPGAAQCAYNHVKVYASAPGGYDRPKEIDAIIVGLIAVATLIVYGNGGETFDFDKVRRVLMSTMHECRKDPSVLDVF